MERCCNQNISTWSKQNVVDNPLSCRLCEEDEESSLHDIADFAECPVMQTYRWEVFQCLKTLPNPPDWTVYQVKKFLKMSPLWNMLESNE